jgi:hypothetical protein
MPAAGERGTVCARPASENLHTSHNLHTNGLMRCSKRTFLFDHLVGAHQDRGRDSKTDRAQHLAALLSRTQCHSRSPSGEVGKYVEVDATLGEMFGLRLKAEPREPIRNLLYQDWPATHCS